LYDLVNHSFGTIDILNYNIDLTNHEGELLGFLKMGRDLGFSYIESYKAYKFAKKKEIEIRKEKEKKQSNELKNNNIKILLSGHPYNLYDEMIGMNIIRYLKKQNITILYSDRIDKDLIDTECEKISTDIHWTHSKEMMASINYYKDKVDGIIILSSFPCGPDSLSNELAIRKVKNIPVLKLIFEDFNSDVGTITRLESFFDILKQKKEVNHESN
jgi:predicted nucleotide-binding protein (sugar kinase/HSP70/actin superfamily)